VCTIVTAATVHLDPVQGGVELLCYSNRPQGKACV